MINVGLFNNILLFLYSSFFLGFGMFVFFFFFNGISFFVGFFQKTIGRVIIDHANSLHKRINSCWSTKRPSSFFQILQTTVLFFIFWKKISISFTTLAICFDKSVDESISSIDFGELIIGLKWTKLQKYLSKEPNSLIKRMACLALVITARICSSWESNAIFEISSHFQFVSNNAGIVHQTLIIFFSIFWNFDPVPIMKLGNGFKNAKNLKKTNCFFVIFSFI